MVLPDLTAMAAAAADRAADILRRAVAARGVAHAMFATGNSQIAFVGDLVSRADVPWADTVVFHMDEYVGVGPDHPAGFRRWIRERITVPAGPRAAHYFDGLAPPEEECARSAGLLARYPLDCKVVVLDAACRRQQVNEGHFATDADVPTRAMTVTIPALLRAGRVLAVAPEARKAEPVRRALEGPVDTACPASALQHAPHATVFLEPESARLLTPAG